MPYHKGLTGTIKELTARIKRFENGEEYVRLQEQQGRILNLYVHEVERLKKELAEARSEKTKVRDVWYRTCLDIKSQLEKRMIDLENDCECRLLKAHKKLTQVQDTLLQAFKDFSEEQKKRIALEKELAEVKAQLETERGKNQALTARINKDYSNSSKSSSLSPNHKIIRNSREKSGRKPGGQLGHAHHGRKLQKPTERREIPAPAKYLEDSNFRRTGKIVRKQLIKLCVTTEVIEYWTPEFRNVLTGQRVHADFPPGIIDDVNYDGTIKATAYILNNDLYTSIDKTKKFLREISGGKIDVSTGFICNLSEQFSNCTEKERDVIFQELLTSPTLHSDFTFGRAMGKQATVLITATDDGKVLYQGRKSKGDSGIAETPVENYVGTLVSDHETSIRKHGTRHQECLTHVQRYAKATAEVEHEKTWAGKMENWVKETIGYWNDTKSGTKTYNKKVAERYIKRFMEILKIAKTEYRRRPKYYRDGYNLYRRMEASPEDYVLFLRDPSVPPTNNVAERFARKFKRKAHQVMSFRSREGVNRFCDGLSVTESMKSQGENLFEAVTDRFNMKYLSPPQNSELIPKTNNQKSS